jgi:nucleoside-diphosphate-sugar epimerase
LFLGADILDLDALMKAFHEFAPDMVVHLAAETRTGQRQNRRAYQINTTGTANVVRAVSAQCSITRCIFASSNVVDRYGGIVADGKAAHPHYLYSESKRVAEKIVLEDNTMRCQWCIIRPCYVWGPWFGAPFKDFFLAVGHRRYVHFGASDARKLFTYVGNIVYQILKLLEAPSEVISRQVFYLSDYEPMTIRQFADMISDTLGISRPRVLPDFLVTLAARFGDALQVVGFKDPPLTSFRLANMVLEDVNIPIERTRSVTGPLPYSAQEGVTHTIEWLKGNGDLA